MDNQPLVTVVIPNYNHEAFLKERIDSVLGQSYEHFELYILDDCSTDGSLSIIESYKTHPKVKEIIINTENSGSLFKQWTKAITLAQGEYLWIAESDDSAHKDFLNTAVNAIAKYTNSGLVFTDSIMIDADSNFGQQASETNKHLISMRNADITNIPSKKNIFEYFISNIIVWNASAVLFKTEIIKQIDTTRLSALKNAGDLYAYLNIALKKDMVFINQPLNYFRQHDQNTTQTNIKSGALYKDRIHIISEMLEELLRLDNSRWHLQVFMSRHFITAVDHGLYSEVRRLLQLYLTHNLIYKSTFKSLTRYVWWLRHFKLTPHRYRSAIKKELIKIVEES